jgi:hypothetical protein
MLTGVFDDPSEIKSSPSDHSGVCPLSRSRHWNFGFTERLKHGCIITPGIASACFTGEQAGNVLEADDFGFFAMRGAPHFSDNSYGFGK